jgi:copper chaperone
MTPNSTKSFNVPSIACSGCISAISLAIANLDPNAKMQGDAVAKTISLETCLEEHRIREAIAKLGHTVA